jgi:hypothetical protein
VIHHLLPHRYRLYFFCILSVIGIAMVLGPVSAAWLLGIGGVLISICHIPVSFRARMILLSLVVASLAMLRAEWFTAPWSSAVWPILGSMFMLRLIIYLYDLKHATTQFSLASSVSYFFMLPNVCFPLFPVVDYATFRNNYYDAEPTTIYQTGVQWMTRGVIHLVLYRFVYYYMTIAPAEVKNAGDFIQYAATTFILYLRISGQFHLIVGMLHLFGFRLPETHHRYMLAASFTDVWRRINIYWKDFMAKVFYYPMYFRLRSVRPAYAVLLSTLFVFFVTWLLHSLQWFWLRGSVLFTGPDVVFYSALAFLVVANSLYEMKYGRRRTLEKTSFGPAAFVKKAACVLATFSAVCLLWSLWQSESISEWVGLWESIGSLKIADLGILSVLAGAVVLGGSAASLPTAKIRIPSIFRQGPLLNLICLTLLAAIGIQGFYTQLGPTAATFINSLRSGRLSRLDMATLQRGYYENLIRVERFNSQLWELYMNRPANWLDVVGTAGLERFTGNFLQKELIPSFESRTNYGLLRTNRWGMRDKEYEKSPPPNTFRVAMLGASSVMGWGVADDETFESIVERQLNSEHARGYEHNEILNFAVPGYSALQQVAMLDKAFSFNPNALFYVAAAREPSTSANYLAEVLNKGLDLPYGYLSEVAQRAGVAPKTTELEATRRLLPFKNDLLSWSYRAIIERSRKHNTPAVLIFLPQVGKGDSQDETPDIVRIAREAGFIVWDLSDVFDGQSPESLRLAEWDLHPNAKAHNIIASRLHTLLMNDTRQVFFTPSGQ